MTLRMYVRSDYQLLGRGFALRPGDADNDPLFEFGCTSGLVIAELDDALLLESEHCEPCKVLVPRSEFVRRRPIMFDSLDELRARNADRAESRRLAEDLKKQAGK